MPRVRLENPETWCLLPSPGIDPARGEAPVYMLDSIVYLRQGSSDVQAQPDDIISLVAEFAF